jgi:hypothetical protein
MVKNSYSIFTNMISRINPQVSERAWPISLELPKLEGMNLTTIVGLDLATPAAAPRELGNTVDGIKKRRCKKVTACPHFDRKHYAKNMCNNCYHRQGRNQLAWDCEHRDRQMYAKGK